MLDPTRPVFGSWALLNHILRLFLRLFSPFGDLFPSWVARGSILEAWGLQNLGFEAQNVCFFVPFSSLYARIAEML